VGDWVKGADVPSVVALVLSLALASPATLADAPAVKGSAALTKYCSSARPFLRYDAVFRLRVAALMQKA
jgi:hypothetical protein